MLLDPLYLVAFLAILPWVAWRKWSGRRPVAAPWERFLGSGPEFGETARPRLWLHGVSVGEVQLLSALEREIAQAKADADRVAKQIAGSGDGGATRPSALLRPCAGPMTSPFGPRSHPIFGIVNNPSGAPPKLKYSRPSTASTRSGNRLRMCASARITPATTR